MPKQINGWMDEHPSANSPWPPTAARTGMWSCPPGNLTDTATLVFTHQGEEEWSKRGELALRKPGTYVNKLLRMGCQLFFWFSRPRTAEETFSARTSQIVDIFSFAGHRDSVAITQLFSCTAKGSHTQCVTQRAQPCSKTASHTDAEIWVSYNSFFLWILPPSPQLFKMQKPVSAHQIWPRGCSSLSSF